MKEHKLNRKLTFALFFVFTLAVILPLYLLLENKGAEIPSLKSLKLGKTTDKEIMMIPEVKRKEKIENGFSYSLSTKSPLRENLIITQEGKATFARLSIAADDISYGKASDYFKKFGQPNKTFKGSNYYGNANTYLYTQEGFAIIGNPNTDTIYEIQKFSPTTIENYLKLYGQDINEKLRDKTIE